MPASIRSHLAVMVIALAIPLLALVGYNIYRDTQDAIVQTACLSPMA